MTTLRDRIAGTPAPTPIDFLATILPEATADEVYQILVGGLKQGKDYSPNYLHLDKMFAALVKYSEQHDVWAATATYPARTKGRLAEDAKRIRSLWQDFDVGEGKPFKTKAEARAHAENLPIKPNAIIDSGGGIQVWWILVEPITGEDFDRATRLIRGVAHVWKGDANVALRSQVMRVPGTFNHKYGEPRPVQLLSLDTSFTYTLDDFAAVGVPEVETQQAQSGARATGGAINVDGLVIDLDADPPQDKLDKLLQLDWFWKTWHHRRNDWLADLHSPDPKVIKDVSQSRYDSAIGATAINHGWTDQETVDLVIANRRQFSPDTLEKLLREDYVQRLLTLCHARDIEDLHIGGSISIEEAAAPQGADVAPLLARIAELEAENADLNRACERKDALNLLLQDRAARYAKSLTVAYRERQQILKTVRHPDMTPIQKIATISLTYDYWVSVQNRRGRDLAQELDLQKRLRITHDGGDGSLAHKWNCSGQTARNVTKDLAAVGVIERVTVPIKNAQGKRRSMVELGMPYLEPWENLQHANSLDYEVKERKPGTGIKKPAPLVCTECPDADLLKSTTCECASCGRVVYATLKKRYPNKGLMVSMEGNIVPVPDDTDDKIYRLRESPYQDDKNSRRCSPELAIADPLPVGHVSASVAEADSTDDKIYRQEASASPPFTPSADWQEIPDGVICPNGGEFRMNFETGRNMGRWPGVAR